MYYLILIILFMNTECELAKELVKSGLVFEIYLDNEIKYSSL